MIIRVFNHFVHDTPLNNFLEKRSNSKYMRELGQLKAKYAKQGKDLPKRFVIFNFPRSGSNFLCTMLNNHPDILCHQEIFNPQKIFYAKNFPSLYSDASKELETSYKEDFFLGKAGLASKTERDLNPERFLANIWQHNYEAQAVGFNLFPTHTPNMAKSLIRDQEVKKILLIRKNKIRCYVSRAIARKTNKWSNFSDGSPQKDNSNITQVYVNPQRLLSWSEKYNKYFNNLRQELIDLNQPFVEVTYEDLIGFANESIKIKLLEFIGVSVQVEALKPLTQKQNTHKTCDLVSNYDELKKQLSGSNLEAFL